jgi:microcystin degradation protein MlrC
MKKRIALLGIYHETNTFSKQATTLAHFQSGFWLEGESITNEYRGAHHEISGIIDVFEHHPEYELVPVFYAYATPSGLVEGDAFDLILSRLFECYEHYGQYDGIVVVPHGAGVAENHPDLDGHWLHLLRQKAGSAIPITGTLDPHANVSPLMVSSTNGLFPYQTNPHIDQARVGRLAARMMIDMLSDGRQFEHTLVQLPLCISIEQQYTSESPCADLLDYLSEVKAEYGLYEASLLLGFPYADVEELGSAFLLISEKGKADLNGAIQKLREFTLAHLAEYNGQKRTINELIPSIKEMEKPTLLLDMGDNVGGGSSARSTHILEELDKANLSGTFICVYDPEAVAQLSSLTTTPESIRIGETGYTIYPERFELIDGKFKELTPKHGGFVNYDMGPSAIVRTKNGQTVMLTTLRTVPFSLQQLLAYDLDPKSFDFIVAKGVNAPIAAYKDVCEHLIKVDTPGDTSADMTRFHFKNRRKPLFPFETPE